MSDIRQAKAEFLKRVNCSCVIIDQDNQIIFESYDNGIKPIIIAVDLMKNAIIADKIIGKAAALICVMGGAKGVYGHVMSLEAQRILKENNIECEAGKLVENIINRQGTDICPMEKLVMNTSSPEDAYKSICEKIGR